MIEDTVTNERGGKQAGTPFFFRGLPPLAIMRIAEILKTGAEKYEGDPFGDVSRRNWHKITSDEHMEHMLYHIVLYLSGDKTEDHRANAATRGLFMLHQSIVEGSESTVEGTEKAPETGDDSTVKDTASGAVVNPNHARWHAIHGSPGRPLDVKEEA